MLRAYPGDTKCRTSPSDDDASHILMARLVNRLRSSPKQSCSMGFSCTKGLVMVGRPPTLCFPRKMYSPLWKYDICEKDAVAAKWWSVDLLEHIRRMKNVAKRCLNCLGWLGWLGWLGCVAWLSWFPWQSALEGPKCPNSQKEQKPIFVIYKTCVWALALG